MVTNVIGMALRLSQKVFAVNYYYINMRQALVLKYLRAVALGYLCCYVKDY